MQRYARLLIVSVALATTTLLSGCIVVPVHRCGYYHCW
jgi:hypothetical protein